VCVWEGLGSNSLLHVGYPEYGVSWYYSVLSNRSGNGLCQYHSLPGPFQPPFTGPPTIHSFKWSYVKTGTRKQTVTYRQTEVLEMVLLKGVKVAGLALSKETEVAELMLYKET
jgi:hypothetical protein